MFIKQHVFALLNSDPIACTSSWLLKMKRQIFETFLLTFMINLIEVHEITNEIITTNVSVYSL